MNIEIIKWIKRAGIAIGSIVAMFLLYVVFAYVRFNWYIPIHIESLYQEGLDNPSKAEWAVKQLQSIEYSDDTAQEKVASLLNIYAKKEQLWAQVMLEQYNEEHKIPIKSIVPINKNIFGITLGKSTKQDVWNYLDSKELWHQELENGEVTQALDNFEFAGIYWNCINYHFVDNIVSCIDFKTREENLNDAYYKLRNTLSSKYTMSKQQKSSKDDSYRPQFFIQDSTTLLKLKLYNYTDNLSKYELDFRYIDLDIKKKKEKQDIGAI